jgi:hypothetical protein
LFIFATLLTFQNFFKMEKFLSIPVTGQSNQLVSANNVILVETAEDSATALTTLITYAGGEIVTITHAAQVAFSMRTAVQDAIVSALQTSWHTPVYTMNPPQAVSDIAVGVTSAAAAI